MAECHLTDSAELRIGRKTSTGPFLSQRLHSERLRSRSRRSDESGVAILLVLFIVALASILVVDLAYSTYLGSRLATAAQRSVQAEYLLKSALNYSRFLLSAEAGTNDLHTSSWAQFESGLPIPGEVVGLPDSNVVLELEIRPTGSRIPVKALIPGVLNKGVQRWQTALVTLFQSLNFDSDGEADQTGMFGNTVFTSEQVVANLVDFVDQDETATNLLSNPAISGVEDRLPDNVKFPNKDEGLQLLELQGVPGLTPRRFQQVQQYLGVYGNPKVNINFVEIAILGAILQSFTPPIDASKAEQIYQFARDQDGGFKLGNVRQELVQLGLSETESQDLEQMVETRSTRFDIVAKVDYGAAKFFLRATVERPTGSGTSEPPTVLGVELY